jgi:aminocarboxymuconate-semialdehyde decarboxylase
MLYSVGYATETGIAAAAIVMSGLLDRHPKLRICFAHGGGTFPWLLPRLDQTWNVFDDVKAGTSRKPSETAKLLTYDTLTYDTNNVSFLIERVGVDRLVMGTDYPFPLREVPPGVVVNAVDTIRSEEREAILGYNALRFLHCSGTSTTLMLKEGRHI